MQFFAIVLMSVAAAVLYGVLHDQVTIRVCLEYFTVFHPKILDDPSPTLLAATWGVLATWWVGLPLGFLLAMAARFGSGTQRTAAELWPSLARLLLLMGSPAAIACVAGFLAHRAGWAEMPVGWASRIPPDRHDNFLAAWWAHHTSYGFAAIGGLWLVGRTAAKRRRAPAKP
jgi:hypothetical protein